MLVFFMGLKDDIVVMSASRKLFVHMAVGAYLVGALDLRIDNFGGLFGLGHIPFWVSAPFSWFVYIVVVNAVNLIDGLDGLIGGFGTLVMTAFGVWFFQTGDLASAIVAFSTAGALLGFWCSTSTLPASSWAMEAPCFWGSSSTRWPFG